jgi:hypothetical protein
MSGRSEVLAESAACRACGRPAHAEGERCPAEGISALWSPDFDAYAGGVLDASRVRCALCLTAPCSCPPFGSPEYFALLDRRHGRPPRSSARA